MEVCAGGGGQALGLEQGGFFPRAVVDLEPSSIETLAGNRPAWPAIQADLRDFDGTPYAGRTDLLAGGAPCPPFSVAGRQLGGADSRDLLPQLVRLSSEIRPRAVLLENVANLAAARFAAYRRGLRDQLEELGFVTFARVLAAADFGVPQLRPRFFLVALSPAAAEHFAWPVPSLPRVTAGAALVDLMAAAGWQYAAEWQQFAALPAPTIVGGSRLHGGPDLGPSRARDRWRQLGVDGRSLADAPPGRSDGHFLSGPGVRLTLRMAARLQGFPDDWVFAGSKTAAYRLIGNALPPQLAQAVGFRIRTALVAGTSQGDRGAPAA